VTASANKFLVAQTALGQLIAPVAIAVLWAMKVAAQRSPSNVVLLPLFTIVDGYRRGLRRPWLYFVSSLFTSFAFAFAFYFATTERLRRHAHFRADQAPQPSVSG
jgi:hypothetical protein